jgi:hypothetical protein
MQLPIKDNISFKITDFSTSNKSPQIQIENYNLKNKDVNAINDQNNPVISQVVFFAKMFEKFVSTESNKFPEEIKKTFDLNSNFEDNQMDVDGNKSANLDYTNIDNLKEIIYKTYSTSINKSISLKKKEKKKMEKIVNLLIYTQMKKIEMKLNYFNEFEKLIQFETQQMKSMESQIIQDRIKLAIKKNELVSLSNKFKDAIKFQDSNYITQNDLINKSQNFKIENDSKIFDLN